MLREHFKNQNENGHIKFHLKAKCLFLRIVIIERRMRMRPKDDRTWAYLRNNNMEAFSFLFRNW